MDAEAGEPPPPELAMVARAVQRLVARNDALLLETAGGGEEEEETTVTTMGGGGRHRRGMAAFEAARGAPAPRIGVAEYLERVHRFAALEPQCYVVAYAYVDRAAHRRPAASVASSRNVHRLLLACLLLASKFLDDFHHSNAFFACVGGVSNAEMNKLEMELLVLLDFEAAVGHRDYDTYRDHLEKEMLRDGGGAAKKASPAAAPGKQAPVPPAPLTAVTVVPPMLPKPNGVPA